VRRAEDHARFDHEEPEEYQYGHGKGFKGMILLGFHGLSAMGLFRSSIFNSTSEWGSVNPSRASKRGGSLVLAFP